MEYINGNGSVASEAIGDEQEQGGVGLEEAIWVDPRKLE